jgi:hypothetical protein
LASHYLPSADRIEADVPHRVRIKVIGGQQACALGGAEQALHGTQDGYGDGGVMLRVHGCFPRCIEQTAVLMSAVLPKPQPADVQFVTF